MSGPKLQTKWKLDKSGNAYPESSEVYVPVRPRGHYSPAWQCILGGFVAAPLTFLLVLFGIRGITRLGCWIIEGFVDNKKKVSLKETTQRS